MSKPDLEELVNAYIALRDARKALEDDYKKQDEVLRRDMDQLEVAMLDVCNTVNANSIKTSHGTVIRRVNERFFCSDWDNFRDFVLQNNAVELLERRIHQGNFKQFMSEHEGDGLPPGVNVMREFGVTVRRSSAE